MVLAVLIGPPLQFFSFLADTGNVDRAFALTFNIAAFGTGYTISTFLGVLTQSAWLLTLFVVFFLPRFIKRRILGYESGLVKLSPEGSEGMSKYFSGIYSIRPVLILTAIITLISIPYLLLQAGLVQGPFSVVYQIYSNLIVSVIFSEFIWVYFRALWGLYKLGKEPLVLTSDESDLMLGLRPIGSTSFSLFLAYMSVIGLSSSGIMLTPTPDPTSLAALVVLAVLSGVMFVLPLNSIHRRMLDTKRRKEGELYAEFARLSALDHGAEREIDLLRSMRDVQLLQIRRERLSKTPTWPFDTVVFGRFAAIILSVTAILLSRMIAVFLRILTSSQALTRQSLF